MTLSLCLARPTGTDQVPYLLFFQLIGRDHVMKQKQLYHVYTLPPSYQLRLITNTLGRRLPIRLDNLRRLHSTITEATCFYVLLQQKQRKLVSSCYQKSRESFLMLLFLRIKFKKDLLSQKLLKLIPGYGKRLYIQHPIHILEVNLAT